MLPLPFVDGLNSSHIFCTCLRPERVNIWKRGSYKKFPESIFTLIFCFFWATSKTPNAFTYISIMFHMSITWSAGSIMDFLLHKNAKKTAHCGRFGEESIFLFEQNQLCLFHFSSWTVGSLFDVCGCFWVCRLGRHAFTLVLLQSCYTHTLFCILLVQI